MRLSLAIPLLIATSTPLAAQCPDGTPPPCNRPVPRAATAAAPNSVAVLYFENNSPDTADVYLADGLTDELITQLGHIGRLAIAPRAAVRRYRGRATDPASLARGLSVTHLVTGSVRRAGTRLRVDVELVRMPGERRLWGESYQRSDGDLFAIQEDIARAITQAVAGTLLPAERAALARAPSRDPVAYDLYLRGSRSLREVDPASVQRMSLSFEEALRRDPTFVAARGRLAYVYGWSVNWGMPPDGMTVDDARRRGLALADQALREDSTTSDAWLGRSFLLFFSDPPDPEGALASARRAVELDSTNAWARQNYGVILRRMGRYEEAIRQYQRGSALAPDFDQTIADLGFIALLRRRYAESRAWYDSALVLLPTGWHHLGYRARANLMLGDTAAALEDSRRSVQLASETTRHLALSARAGLLGRAGDTVQARALIEPVMARFATGPITVRDGIELAGGLVGAGRREQAIAVLERVRPRGAWLWSYLPFPDFDAIRQDPRFQRIVNESAPPNAPRLP